jgi:hypothetical protein
VGHALNLRCEEASDADETTEAWQAPHRDGDRLRARSSYDPNGSEWALNTAVSDQFQTLAAVESTVLPNRPAHVIAVGTSMGGLISALEAQQGRHVIDGSLTTCGIVGGGVNLNEYQIDGEYAVAQLLGNPATQLVGFGDPGTALGTAGALTAAAGQAQRTAAGRARLALAMAFLNVTPWNPTDPAPVSGSDPAGQEAAQYTVMFGGGFNIMDFIELGRISIEQADGGQATWDVGTDFARLLANSPYKREVFSLYRAAGLNLSADLATLTANTSIKADPAALRSLYQTSVPTGRLAVPELTLHTIGDNLVPVQHENYYRHLVDAAWRWPPPRSTSARPGSPATTLARLPERPRPGNSRWHTVPYDDGAVPGQSPGR